MNPLGSLGSHLTVMDPRPLTAQCEMILLWSFGWTTWNLGCWARMNSTTQFRWSTRPSAAFPMQLLGSSLGPIVHLTGGAACEKSSGYRGGMLGPKIYQQDSSTPLFWKVFMGGGNYCFLTSLEGASKTNLMPRVWMLRRSICVAKTLLPQSESSWVSHVGLSSMGASGMAMSGGSLSFSKTSN